MTGCNAVSWVGFWERRNLRGKWRACSTRYLARLTNWFISSQMFHVSVQCQQQRKLSRQQTDLDGDLFALSYSLFSYALRQTVYSFASKEFSQHNLQELHAHRKINRIVHGRLRPEEGIILDAPELRRKSFLAEDTPASCLAVAFFKQQRSIWQLLLRLSSRS